MSAKKITAVFLAVITILCVCASCAAKEKQPIKPIPELPETVEPFSPELVTDYTEDEATLGIITDLRSTFTQMAETLATDFSFTTSALGVTVTKYNGSAEKLRIPEEINGQAVIAIADGAFAENQTVKALYIPDSVQSLGAEILKDCKVITALRTPILGADKESDQYLGYLFGADSYANNARDVPASLAYLELGGNATTLADFALFDCNDLVCITLPESMTALGTYSFYQCNSLLAINTEHLTSIADHAMDSCSSLTRLEFGEALTSVGLGALEGCVGLRSLTLPFVGGTPTANTYLAYIFGATTPEFAKGYYPPYLTEIELLSTCTTLGDYAFYRCEGLQSIKLSETLTSIGLRAFNGCKRLAKIELPATLQSIRENAFFDCISLSFVVFGENASLNTIGVNAFYGCSALTEIVLPNSLKSLSPSCFADCLQLKKVDFGGVTAVGKNAFRNCRSLTTLRVNAEITFEDGNEYATRLLVETE